LDNGKLDLYELYYNSVKICEKSINTMIMNDDNNFERSNNENALLNYIIKKRNDDTKKDILLDNIIKEINDAANIKFQKAFKFTDIQYIQKPIFEGNKMIGLDYELKLLNKNVKLNTKDAIKKYDNFNIDNLPLIEIARFLNIIVRKLKSDENYGSFDSRNNTIILRTDSPGVYLHELSHAIDIILKQYDYNDKNINEVVAELSRLYLCRKYNIENDDKNSIAYIKVYKKNMIMNKDNEIINRVKNINYFIIECKLEIEKRHKAEKLGRTETASSCGRCR
jgi:hypothetical protein